MQRSAAHPTKGGGGIAPPASRTYSQWAEDKDERARKEIHRPLGYREIDTARPASTAGTVTFPPGGPRTGFAFI